MFLTLSTTGG